MRVTAEIFISIIPGLKGFYNLFYDRFLRFTAKKFTNGSALGEGMDCIMRKSLLYRNRHPIPA